MSSRKSTSSRRTSAATVESPVSNNRSRSRSRSTSRAAPASSSRSRSRSAAVPKSASKKSTSTSARKSTSSRSRKTAVVESESEEEEEEIESSPVAVKRSRASTKTSRHTDATPERSVSRTRVQEHVSPVRAAVSPAARSTVSPVQHTSATVAASPKRPVVAAASVTDNGAVFSTIFPGAVLYLLLAFIAHALVMVAVESFPKQHGRLEGAIIRRWVDWGLFTHGGATKVHGLINHQLRLFEFASIPLYLAANSLLRKYTRIAFPQSEVVADYRAGQLSTVLHGITTTFTFWLLHHYGLWANIAGVRIIATVIFSYYLSEQVLNCRVHTTPARLQYTALIGLAGWIMFAGYFTGDAKSFTAAGSLAVQQAFFYAFVFITCAETAKYEAKLVGSTWGTNSVLYQFVNILLHALYALSVPVFTYFYFNDAAWKSASPHALGLLQAVSAAVFLFINAAASLLDQEEWRAAQ